MAANFGHKKQSTFTPNFLDFETKFLCVLTFGRHVEQSVSRAQPNRLVHSCLVYYTRYRYVTTSRISLAQVESGSADVCLHVRAIVVHCSSFVLYTLCSTSEENIQDFLQLGIEFY